MWLAIAVGVLEICAGILMHNAKGTNQDADEIGCLVTVVWVLLGVGIPLIAYWPF